MVVSCTNTSYAEELCAAGAYDINNATIMAFPANALHAGDSDHHIAGGTATYEYDFWDTNPLGGKGSTIYAGGGGVCLKSGDGVGCAGATATKIPLSLGHVQAQELLDCMQSTDQSCVLPHAISVAFRCNGPAYVLPASASDSQCFDPKTGKNLSSPTVGITEGIRGAVNWTDAQINAKYKYNSYQAIILRTMGLQHYGFVNRDSAWSQGPGISLQYQSGQEFTVQGKPDPWKTVASLAGIPWNSSGVQFPMGMAPPLIFCSNAGC
jgi:hypothetical protein